MEAPTLPQLGADQVRTASRAVRTLGALARTVLRSLQWGSLLLAAVAAVGLGVLPRLGYYRTLTVLSASMVPTFRPGDIVVVRPEPITDLRVGDVITYVVPVGAHQVETHRVIKIYRGRGTDHPVVETQGDANNAPDPWTTQLDGPTIWRLTAVVPKAGYALNALRGRTFHLISVLLIPALLAAGALAKLWRPDRDRDGDA